MTFYNRQGEIAVLDRALARPRPQFIVLYGRRRCGKSTLLQHIANEGDCYSLAIQGEASLQRSLLSQTIAQKFAGFDRAVYPNWMEFFRALADRGGKRYTLIIDEFPYLAKSDPSLPSILQALLEDRSKLPFHLVLCGSSQQMMEGTILSATSPLFGRADEILKITPLLAGYLKDHMPESTAVNLMEEYSIWGGVPRYWELRARYKDMPEAVYELLLQPIGLLYDEPRRLLLDDMTSLVQPLSLLTFIAGGVNRLSELGGRMEKPAAELSRPLNRLIELGYIEKLRPFNAPLRSNRQTLYRVADSFMRFYHRYVVPNASKIEQGRKKEVWMEIEQSKSGYCAQTWETLTRSAIARGLIDGSVSACSPWWGTTKAKRKVEIDGVAQSPDGKHLILCECKWSEGVDTQPIHQKLAQVARELPFYNGQEVTTVVATKEGGNSAHDIGAKEVLDKLR
ncbi:MAG: ATP-binding protein [Bacteroidota bacterium]